LGPVIEQLLPALIAVGVILLVSFPVHEFSHAYAAFRLGDSTARYMGRLTLDPRVHLDPLGGGMLVLSAILSGGNFFFGYAKPTPVNPVNLDGGRRGEAIVALAGPLSNLIMAAVVALPVRYILSSPGLQSDIAASDVGNFVFSVAVYFVVINVFLFLFNLLPIPPLDGWKVLTGVVDAHTAYRLRQLEQYAFFLILLVFFLGGRIISPIASAILELLVGRRLF
jgi:Zn-dependent protease